MHDIPEETLARFWSKVRKTDDDTCWEWTGCVQKRFAYGCFSAAGESSAHRVSWVIHSGPIRGGLWVLHKCDNPRCVRPDHLFLGTPTDNVRDMHAKGRAWVPTGDRHWSRKAVGLQTGAKNFNARLDESDVAKIKAALVAGRAPGALAREHGVSGCAISLISSGANWPHVPWPDGAAFDINCNQALRSRGVKVKLARMTGGVCVEVGCENKIEGVRMRCAQCWTARRRASKTEHARLVRQAA